MSDCRVPMPSHGRTVAKLNENNRRLRKVSRAMYQCLMTMPSGWEDQEHHVKYFHDELMELGVL